MAGALDQYTSHNLRHRRKTITEASRPSIHKSFTDKAFGINNRDIMVSLYVSMAHAVSSLRGIRKDQNPAQGRAQ